VADRHMDAVEIKGIKPEMQETWKKHIAECLDLPEPDRQAVLFTLAQVAQVVEALSRDVAPGESVKNLDPKVDLIVAANLAQVVSEVSVRGEEFRLWWNAWHDRTHPDDTNPARKSRREVFNPGLINVKGHPVQIMARFDPEEPLTKRADYSEIVKNAIKSAGISIKV
jgi:hypothetical protein